MTNKTKPIYLIIAGILISFAIIIFIFLLVQTRNTVELNASESAIETQSAPKTSYKNRVDYTEPTEETSCETTSQTSIDNVIRAKGLYRDKKDNVYDSDKNEYEVIDGNVFIVYQGNLYKIPVESLKIIKATEKPKKKKVKATEPPKVENENNSSQHNSYEYGSGFSNSSVSVNQPNNVVKPTSKPKSDNKSKNKVNKSDKVVKATEKPKVESKPEITVRMSYSSLGVKNGQLFSLALAGADNSVSWSVDGHFVKIINRSGNHCTFKANNCGASSVIAQYNGNTYSCYITIS